MIVAPDARKSNSEADRAEGDQMRRTTPRARLYRFRRILVVAALLGCLSGVSSHRFSTGAASGGPMSATRTIAGEYLRFGTFNIHGAKGGDGKRDLSRIEELLRAHDVVGLNEVHGGSIFGAAEQSSVLAKTLNMNAIFAPTEIRWGQAHFGNAALSALSVKQWRRIPLDRVTGGSGRNMLLLDVEHGGVTYHVLISHLSRKNEETRTKQLAAVIEKFLAMPTPAILMGDMNTVAADPQMRELLSVSGVNDPLSAVREKKLPQCIDWILTRGCETAEGDIVLNDASDHPELWVDLRAVVPAPSNVASSLIELSQ